ncbi:hypothetical protein J6590_054622 [Homalodisca vitripennis]|nr:hypothetical protein J6590_054622 [Homalodisca vitripennis]
MACAVAVHPERKAQCVLQNRLLVGFELCIEVKIRLMIKRSSYTSGVNSHNCRILGLQQPNIVAEHVHDSPKVNMWCGLLYDQVLDRFFFAEKTINVPQIEDIEEQAGEQVILMQDGVPSHYLREVHDLLNNRFPNEWIGKCAPIP